MKVTKIDIKKEVMEIENKPYLDFIEYGPIKMEVLNEGEIPTSSITNTAKRYIVQKVKQGGKEPENLLIPIDERGLFETFLDISNNLLEALISKRVEYLNEEFAKDMQRNTVETYTRIKKLPFWKRLFNNF